jgi:hypothetical protein
VKASFPLRTVPTVKQTQTILAQIERELRERGAHVDRPTHGRLSFRMPLPWRAPKLRLLLAVTSGYATISASGGGPWRVSYDLNFSALRAITTVLSLALVTVGWQWNRLTLLNALFLLWALVFGSLYVAGTVRFRSLLKIAAGEVVERRRAVRVAQAPDEDRDQPPVA